MLNFSHHITTATLSLIVSFFPHSFSCHPLGALFNSLILSAFNVSNFLSFFSCHSACHQHILLLFLSSFPLSHLLSFCAVVSLFFLTQSLYFYELRDSVIIISIFLWYRTGLVTGVTALRFTAHTQTQARINIMLSHGISSLLTKCLSHMHKMKKYSSPVSRGIHRTIMEDTFYIYCQHSVPVQNVMCSFYRIAIARIE